MADHAEEQEMEAEALSAIFESHFVVNNDDNGKQQRWMITIYPEQQGRNEAEVLELNHVAVNLHVELPRTYPEEAVPVLQIEIVRGLCQDPHGIELLQVAEEEAESNLGVPSIFAIAERVREWLIDHNRPGLDDTSAYASMIRKELAQKEQEQKKAKATAFESQTTKEEYTEAELEELIVNKRRAEGTPCNQENFDVWSAKFQAEMRLQQQQQRTDAAADEVEASATTTTTEVLQQQQSNIVVVVASTTVKKMTGYDYFASKTTNLEALEAAAERMQEDANNESPETGGGGAATAASADLFDDDVDLDDLDFDDDDEDEDDDEDDDDDDDEDPDI